MVKHAVAGCKQGGLPILASHIPLAARETKELTLDQAQHDVPDGLQRRGSECQRQMLMLYTLAAVTSLTHGQASS